MASAAIRKRRAMRVGNSRMAISTFQPPPPRPRAKSATSCQSIGRALRQHGYRQVRPVDCGGVNYKYVAYLGYQRYLLRVNSLDGTIIYEINY